MMTRKQQERTRQGGAAVIKRSLIIAVMLFMFAFTAIAAPAPTSQSHLVANSHGEIVKHFLGSAVNTGTNNGFSGSNNIGERDPHFGWVLGRFFVSGYTRVTGDMNEPIFIRTLGDTITLNFNLEQDIDALNGNNNLVISENDNAFDAHFGIERTNFERGALIIRHTDWRNFTGDPVVYTNFLSAHLTDANTWFDALEEGDYEVALNYATYESGWFGTRVFGSTNNYRIFFRFSVRNGESIVFPRDTTTGAELTNRSVTPHGFYLDLALSRFLDIDIKREVLVQGADGLTEDTRFNRPARDGVQYTDEGIYTITARNRYTNQETAKRIYVGTNNVLIAHMNTGYSINEINQMVALGAFITDEGDIIQQIGDEEHTHDVEPTQDIERNQDTEDCSATTESEPTDYTAIVIIAGLILVVVVLVLFVLHFTRKNKTPTKQESGGDGE
jgi:hypothetical protein